MEIKKIENCDYVMFPRLQEQVTTGSSISRPSPT